MKSRNAFTLIEMLVVIAIIAMLASILVPAVSASLARARGVRCISNIRSITQASFLWAVDNEPNAMPGEINSPPNNDHWVVLIRPYLGTDKIKTVQNRRGFHCPETDGSLWNLGYAMNVVPGYPEETKAFRPDRGFGKWYRQFDITHPSDRIRFVDSHDWQVNHNYLTIAPRHRDRASASFWDGSVRSLTMEQAEKAIIDP
ncbi:MAG: type II secretion system protein [Kiritimatiellia bacterium]